MKYCFECGTKLIDKPLEGEGIIPFCEKCNTYRFPIFSTAVSMIIHNPTKDKILLIQQYGKPNNVLVAGYINRGENAETAVVREVKEEIGLNIVSYEFNASEYFERTNTLMVNFVCIADSESLDHLSPEEIDKAKWFTCEEAREAIMPNSLAKKFLLKYLDRKNK